MDLIVRSILILGGYGLVGQAVARRLLLERPRRLTLLSLKQEEAEAAVRLVAPEAQGTSIDAAWGDVFAFADWKDLPRRDVFPRRRTARASSRACSGRSTRRRWRSTTCTA
jgi:NAD(P)-dependent dehydrogenase (short-subunit alcohol dehydrogenase family)